MKQCCDCKQEKILAEFSKFKNSKDGLANNCKECAKAYAKAWREKTRFNGIIVKEKYCSGCEIVKTSSEFYNDKSRQDGLSSQCKHCKSLFKLANRPRLLEEAKARNKERSEREKIKVEGRICAQCKIYKTSDQYWKSIHTLDGLYSCCIECKKLLEATAHRQIVKYNNGKNWRKNNIEKSRNTSNQWDKNRRTTDVSYRLRRNVMHAVIASVRNYSFNNKLERLKGAIFAHLPYTADELKTHIESLWEPWMTWDNYGRYRENEKTWQIDHIIPQSKLPYESFEDDNFKKSWNLNNLRPLETIANIKKSNKIINV